MAAATTSLPETPGGERNWDYRYCWMRDATFTLWALHALGFDWEADDFMQFVADLERDDDGRLQIMYGIGGRARPARGRARAPGRLRGGAFRCGSATAPSPSARTTSSEPCSTRSTCTPRWAATSPSGCGRCCATRSGRAIEIWQEPDQGIWEARGAPKHYVSSKLMCWVAVDRGARLAELVGETALAQEWGEIAEQIKADILEHGRERARRVPPALRDRRARRLDAADPAGPLPAARTTSGCRATVLAIADELTEDGFVLRYRVEETDDGLSGTEGTFLICSFWLVSALCEIGEAERARALCERLLSHASPLLLYAEELEAAAAATSGTSRRRSPTWR